MQKNDKKSFSPAKSANFAFAMLAKKIYIRIYLFKLPTLSRPHPQPLSEGAGWLAPKFVSLLPSPLSFGEGLGVRSTSILITKKQQFFN
jgi:hypothetical protein